MKKFLLISAIIVLNFSSPVKTYASQSCEFGQISVRVQLPGKNSNTNSVRQDFCLPRFRNDTENIGITTKALQKLFENKRMIRLIGRINQDSWELEKTGNTVVIKFSEELDLSEIKIAKFKNSVMGTIRGYNPTEEIVILDFEGNPIE